MTTKREQLVEEVEKEKEEWLKQERARIMLPWRRAINKLRERQNKECGVERSEVARFQDGSLERFLAREIRSMGDDIAPVSVVMDSYWLFVGSPFAEHLGYDAAQKMHRKEMEIHGISGPFELSEKDDWRRKVDELRFRLSSLAAWIEAYEGYTIWCDLSMARQLHSLENPYEFHRGMAARMLANLGKGWNLSNEAFAALWLGGELGGREGSGLIADCNIQNSKEWAKLLRKAADLAKETITLTEQERWVWWMYPIFGRYKWSASQVFEAAYKRFGEYSETTGDVASFQAKWIRRGIRFTGKRGKQQDPEIWRFVLYTEIPDRDENPRYRLWR